MSSEDTHTLTTRLAAVEAERDAALRSQRYWSGEANRASAELVKLRLRAHDAEANLVAALARAERAEKALEDACRLDTIRLKVGELSAKELQLASIVAGLIRGSVAAALSPVAEEA